MTNSDDTKPAPTHTAEPWEVIPARGTMLPHVMGGDHCRLALLDDCHADPRERDANGRRMVAAVNACQGLSTEALEQGVVSELLEQCKTLARRLPELDEDDTPLAGSDAVQVLADLWPDLKAVLAKATERAAEASAMPRDQESGSSPRLREMDRRRLGEALRRKQRER